MADDETVDREVAERARKLYWSSDRSVNSIANDLGLSKGRLYGLIDPLPSSTPCPRCGTEMVFETRSAKDKGTPSCPVCTAEARGKRPLVSARPADPAAAPPAAPKSALRRPESAPDARPEARSDLRSTSQPRPRPEGGLDPSRLPPPPRASRPPAGGGSSVSNTKILAGVLLGAFAGLLLYRLVRRRPE